MFSLYILSSFCFAHFYRHFISSGGITEDYSELGAVDLPWSIASNTTIGRPNQNDWDYFSAVCWYTIRNIFEYQNGTVPVGGVVQSYGGTSIQYWSSDDAIKACSAVYYPGERKFCFSVV